MLQSRLTRLTVTACAVVSIASVASCSDGGTIENNLIRPGITALDRAGALSCGNDAAAMRTAIDAYQAMEGTPPPDEQALIDGQYLRNGSDLWDVVDGRLVAVGPDCVSAQSDAPEAVEIVTSTEPPRSADEVFDELGDADVSAIGGEQCARQLAAVLAGLEQFIVQEGRQPDGLDELADAGYFVEPVTLWQVVDDVLAPTADSGCNDLAAIDD